MTDAEIDAHAAMNETARRVRAGPCVKGLRLAIAGVVLAVLMFSFPGIPGLGLAGGLAVGVAVFVAGLFRLLANVGPSRFESMQQSRASMRQNRPKVEEFRFRVRRAWSVHPVDEDSEAFLLDVGDDYWMYTNGCVHASDGAASGGPTIPSVWSVTRWPNGGPVEADTEPPAIQVRELDRHPEQLPKVIVDADWTLVLLSFDQLPTEWQASVRSDSSS
jgi:hypothetical protein